MATKQMTRGSRAKEQAGYRIQKYGKDARLPIVFHLIRHKGRELTAEPFTCHGE